MVYLIYDKETKLTKIGKSNNPIERAKGIKVGNPNSILVWYSPKYEEKQLHIKFKEKRKYGEWFSLDKQDYFNIIGNTKGLPKSIYYRKSIPEIAKKSIKLIMNTVIIKRSFENIGWIDKLNFINLKTEKPIKLRSYNGCLCFIVDDVRIGYKTWKRNAKECKIEIDNNPPF